MNRIIKIILISFSTLILNAQGDYYVNIPNFSSTNMIVGQQYTLEVPFGVIDQTATEGCIKLSINLPPQISPISVISTPVSDRFTWTLDVDVQGTNNVPISAFESGVITIIVQANIATTAPVTADALLIENPPGCDLEDDTETPDQRLSPPVSISGSLSIDLKDIKIINSQCGESVRLIWNTSTERNSNYMEIERSINGLSFYPQSKIYSTNSENGSSYEYIDTNVSSGTKYYYRLREVDFDGRSQIHRVVSILTNNCSGKEVNMQVQPNPAFDRLNVVFNGFTENNKLELVITNVTGEIVMKIPDAVTNDVNKVSINHLSPGIYNINAVGYENILSKRFIKVE